jgi:adenylate kinase family enzyme
MNKGFILEGYPRTEADARSIFMDKISLHAADEEPRFEERVNEKIVPQYALYFEAEDSFLIQKAKELPPHVLEGSHWNDAGMNRRLKEYRAKNPESGAI